MRDKGKVERGGKKVDKEKVGRKEKKSIPHPADTGTDIDGLVIRTEMFVCLYNDQYLLHMRVI